MTDLNLTSDQSGINVGGFTNPFNPPAVPTGPITPPASISEFQYVSQFSMPTVGIQVNVLGVPTDVGTVSMAMYPMPMPGTSLATAQSATTSIFGSPAVETSTGLYSITLTPNSSSVPGFYRLDWSFGIPTGYDQEDYDDASYDETPQLVSSYVQVGTVAPAYDNLPLVMKQMVEDVWLKFADGYDSPTGGPNVQMWYQTHFGRGRVAQLLYQAIQHLSNIAQPSYGFSADGLSGPMFPIAQWSGLLNSALTVEVIKHLMRAYVEDPDIQGAVQARMIRRDYLSRWASMLAVEQADLKAQQDTWKISMMFTGQPRVLVAGGAYPNFYNNRYIVGALAARGMYRPFWF